MKKLDQLGCPSLWLGEDLKKKTHKSFYSSCLKSLQKREMFTENGMLQQRWGLT